MIDRCDFAQEIGLDEFAKYLMSTGFQATNVAFAIEEINRMVRFVFGNCSFSIFIWLRAQF